MGTEKAAALELQQALDLANATDEDKETTDDEPLA